MTKAVIVGGGIAGTAVAIALQRVGIEAVIAEAFDVNADGVGAFLTLAPNGVRGLRQLGVHERALAAGFDTPRFALSLGNGRPLAEMSAGACEDGATRTIRRADLYVALRREVEARGIPIHYGKRLSGAERRGDTVIARFDDGSELEGDLLIGADGLRSKVRTLVDPSSAPLRYVGLLNTGGFAPGVDVRGADGTVHFVFGKKSFFGWVKHPSGEVWWFANPGRKKEPRREELASIAPDAWRAELIDLFSEDASPAVAIVEATPQILGPWPTHDLPSAPIWHRDRMLIVGDAAHATSPSSGQGASMAIEDAIVLAKCLRDRPDIDSALAAYERLRRDRVEKVVAQGKRNGDGKTPGPFGRAIRDLVLRVVLSRARVRDPMAWIHEHRIEWDSPAQPR